MGYVQLKKPENDCMLFIEDLIISLYNLDIIYEIHKKLHNIALNSNNKFIKDRVEFEINSVFSSFIRPISSEVILKSYSILYSNDSDVNNFNEVFKNSASSSKAKKRIKKIFPENVLYSLRCRYLAHLDMHHQDSNKDNIITQEELTKLARDTLNDKNIKETISLWEVIYNNAGHKDDKMALIGQKAAVLYFWISYIRGFKEEYIPEHLDDVIQSLKKEIKILGELSKSI